MNPVFAGCNENIYVYKCVWVGFRACVERNHVGHVFSRMFSMEEEREEMEYELSPERLSPRVSQFSLTPRSDSGPSKVCGRDFGESARTAPS